MTSQHCQNQSRLAFILNPNPDAVSHLDAVLELVSRVVGTFSQELAEDDDLLKEENTALFTARQNPAVLLPHTEGLLLQQLPLRRQLPLDIYTGKGTGQDKQF